MEFLHGCRIQGFRSNLSPEPLSGSPKDSVVVDFQSLGTVRLFVTPRTVAFQASLSMGFPGKNIGVGCHFLLQGVFKTQGLNPCLLLGRWIFYHWAIWETPSPKDRSIFKSMVHVNVTLFGKGVFADVIKLGILGWDHPGLPRCALSPVINVLKREDTEGEEAM